MSTSLWDAPIWQDSGTWIVLGISLLFLVVGAIMHRTIMKVVRTPPPPDSAPPENQPPR
ncbi:hypothetical protein [Giesbergeria anulus]|uniref:Uncharacterized protein n=1 Tax=Giesbergeria anulus TaxID=180197 RepID=A0A1H9LK78_9BURK|nr:hypothetical protein [Giesbergeria anulus]SER11788.1 hypothetical protein SAMN02982919_01782 [Giesbergeria anulus]